MRTVGDAYDGVGDYQRAIGFLERSVALNLQVLGADHPDTLNGMHNLAVAYCDAGKLDLALPLLWETFKLMKAKLGPENPHTLASMNDLAATYWKAGQLDKSIPMFENVLRIRDMTFGRGHPDTLQARANLAVNYMDSGRFAEALPLLEEAYRASKEIPSLLWVSKQLLDGYARAGKSEKAASLAKELVADERRQRPKDSLPLAAELASIGATLLRKCLCGRRIAPPRVPGHPREDAT